MSMRVVFAGSPSVAVPYLEALIAAGCDVVAAITRVDAPVGRQRVMTETPVAAAATRHAVPVIKTNSLRDTEIPPCDVAVVVAYGGLVPSRLLDVPRHGWVNVHFSLLPALRGAAPLQRSMWEGRNSGGVTIFRLVEELDAGPVLASRAIDFLDDETASEALERFARETSDFLVDTLRLLHTGAIEPREQLGEPSFAPKFERRDGRVNWDLPAAAVSQRIRAVTDEPGAFTVVGDTTLGILRAHPSAVPSGPPGQVTLRDDGVVVGTRDGSLVLDVVKPAGKGSMNAADWFRGVHGTVVFE